MEARVALRCVRVAEKNRLRCRERFGVLGLLGTGLKDVGSFAGLGSEEKKRWVGLKRNGMCVRIGSCLLPTLGEFSFIRNP